MRIHWIRFVNIAKYKDVRIDFDGKGLMALLGTNGIGKTHLIQGPALLLWGKKAKGKKTYTLYDAMSWGATDCMVEGEFTHMGVRYYAWRKAKVSKTGKSKSSNASLYLVCGEKRELLAGDSTTDFDEKVRGLFGSLEVYLACVLAAQKGAGDLLEADRTERYDLFAQMTGASGLLVTGELAKEKMKEVWGEVQACAGSADLLRRQAGDLEAMNRELNELQGQLIAAQGELEQKRARIQEIEVEGGELSRKAREFEAAAARLSELTAQEQEIRHQMGEVEQELDRARDAQRRLPELRQRIQVLQQAERTLEQLREADKAWSLLTAEASQRSTQITRAAAEIQAEEQQLDAEGREAEQLDQSLAAWAQARAAWEAASAAEQQRRASWQAISSEIQGIQNELNLLTQQSTLAADAPAPADVCRSCKLVGHALAARDQIPLIQQRLAQAQVRLDQVRQPIQVPPYNPADHERTQRRRTMLGDIAARRAALGSHKRELTEQRYTLEDVNERIQRMNYDPQQCQAAAKIVEENKNAPTELGILDTVSITLPSLTVRLEGLSKQQGKLCGEMADIQLRYGERGAMPVDLQSDLEKLRQEHTVVRGRIQALEEAQGRLQGQLGAKQAMLEKGRHQLAEAKRYEDEREKWNAKYDRLARLKSIFSKTGVLPMIIRQAVPEIERLADQMLEAVWNSLGRLRIVTDGGNGKEVIDLFVEDERGRHSVELYSGGEEQILRIILRLAIGRWRAQRSGQSYDMIGFDEAFDALAPENAGKVISLLRGMLEFVSQVMVISHTDDTVLEFDDKLMLTQEGSEVSAMWRN